MLLFGLVSLIVEIYDFLGNVFCVLALREKELSDTCQTTEKEKIDLKNNLKQAREREKRVNEDVFGLEEENVHLLQQVNS